MTRFRLIAVAAVAVLGVLAGCGTDAAQAAAQKACEAYADTGRHQVATTVAQGESIRSTARSQARRAADGDHRWQPLRRDIEDAFAHAPSQNGTDVTAYFAADRRVQADCASTGEDIGPLRP